MSASFLTLYKTFAQNCTRLHEFAYVNAGCTHHYKLAELKDLRELITHAKEIKKKTNTNSTFLY